MFIFLKIKPSIQSPYANTTFQLTYESCSVHLRSIPTMSELCWAGVSAIFPTECICFHAENIKASKTQIVQWCIRLISSFLYASMKILLDIVDISWRCRDWDSYASRSAEYRIKYWHQKIGILISISKTITIVFILQKDKPSPS